jgi:hypothetical protein
MSSVTSLPTLQRIVLLPSHNPKSRNGKCLPDYAISNPRTCCSLCKDVSMGRNANDFMDNVMRMGCQLLIYKKIFFKERVEIVRQ